MDEKEIIEAAKKAGFYFQTFPQHEPIQHTTELAYSQKCFERFARIIEAKTLERSAKMCEEKILTGGPQAYATAIRALGEKK